MLETHITGPLECEDCGKVRNGIQGTGDTAAIAQDGNQWLSTGYTNQTIPWFNQVHDWFVPRTSR